ncbi:MAG: multicopper oxidase domain-containing protein [Thermomicrobiales bacterium]
MEKLLAPVDRRGLVKLAAGLGLAIPVGGFVGEQSVRAQEPTPTPPGAPIGSGGEQPGTGSGTPIPQPPTTFTPMDPVLVAVQPGPKKITLTAKETTVFVAQGVTYAGWSFEGTIPSTPMRMMVGDEITVTVRNEAQMAHSLDTHAAQTPPNVNYPVVQPGQEYTWRFTPKYPGAFMYHCGTPPVLMHIGAGMYGAMIVDPKEGWPPAQEIVFVQSEFYLTDGPNGVKTPDFGKLMQYGSLDYAVFNGYANQYVEHPIAVKVGEPIRIFVVNAGPNIWSSFHVVGAVFDAAYVNANPANKLVGLQSITIGPGDGACVELTIPEPGTYPAVNHAFGHAQHGAIALLQAT